MASSDLQTHETSSTLCACVPSGGERSGGVQGEWRVVGGMEGGRGKGFHMYYSLLPCQ